MHRRWTEDERAERESAPQRPSAPPPQHELLLRLQRSAGNAAVGRMMRARTLARDPVEAPPQPADAAPAPAAEVDPNSFAGRVETVKAKIEELKTADATLKAATTKADKKAAKKARETALAAHQAAVIALATWTRENTPPRAILDGYLDRLDVRPADKVATLGQLAAGVARMEFLLGTMYHQGTAAKWETTENRGAFPDTYDAAVGGGAQPWCTKFAGYAYTRLGFQANAAGTTSEFMSGWRLRHWATRGQGTSNEQITAADQTAEDATGTGSAVIDNTEWKKLRADLAKATTPEDRTAVTEAFFANDLHPVPQAGDIVIKPRGDAASNNEFTGGGKSHTMLVESFDAATYQIHTIEGNVGDKVGGRTIDLTNATDVSKIIALTRMGTQFFGHAPTAAGGPGATGMSISGPAASVGAALGGGVIGGIAERLTKAVLSAVYSAENLTGGMAETNARLVEINAAQGWIQSSDPNASVTDFTGASGSGNES
jgi:hypothetical protein